jgi:hypothetical protein
MGTSEQTRSLGARMMDDHDTPLTYNAVNAVLRRAGRPAPNRGR